MTRKDTRGSVCHSCGKAVIWALWHGGDSNGKTLPIEECPEGEGRVSLQYPLLKDQKLNPVASLVSNPTKYRKHIDTCKNAAAWREAWKKGKPGRQFPARQGDASPASFTGRAPTRKKP